MRLMKGWLGKGPGSSVSDGSGAPSHKGSGTNILWTIIKQKQRFLSSCMSAMLVENQQEGITTNTAIKHGSGGVVNWALLPHATGQ